MGFIKNKYIGRTFISPGQASREDKVKIKLNPIASTVRGKRVIMIDDSIVRGTTCARIVRLLREAGATEVHIRISGSALSKSVLLRNGYRFARYADRVPPYDTRDRRDSRSGFARLPQRR